MALLAASIVALFAGPAIIAVLGRRPWTLLAIDAFVVVAIGGLVLLHILPESVVDAGWPALLAAAAGLLAPVLVHGPLDECSGRGTRPLVTAAVIAIALHAFLDGVGLLQLGPAGKSLAWAVLLHRVLEGLAIYWLVRPHHGPRGTAMLVGVIAIATTAGFLGGDAAVGAGLGPAIAIVQAAVAGSLLHVLLRHTALGDAPPPGMQWVSGVAGLAAALLLFLLGESHVEGSVMEGGGTLFLQLAGAAAPALLLSYACVAVMHMARPEGMFNLGSDGPRLGQALRGAFAGLAETVCSCGVIPLYRKVIESRATPATALAYLVAAPAVGSAALFLSWVFLGPALTAARVVAALCTAVTTGLCAGDLLPAPAPHHEHTHPTPSIPHRLLDGVHFALGEVVDHSAPWVLFGLGLSTVFFVAVDPAWLVTLQANHIEVLVLAALGTPFYLSASAATFVGAALLAKGASAGGILAFLTTSSAACMSTAGFLQRAHGRRIGVTFTAVVFVCAVLCGLLAGVLITSTPPESPPLDATLWATGVVVAALYFVALLRQGVRPFLAQVAVPNTLGAHSHHHGHQDLDSGPS